MIKGKHDISYTEVDPGEDPTTLTIIAKEFKLFIFFIFRCFTLLFLCVLVN